MSLVIITRKPNNYFSKEYLKFIARKFLGKKRGPHAVIASLIRGLDELGVDYKINKQPNNLDTVYVNESLDALIWAIKLKKEGKISKLIAGPNILVTPDEHNSLVTSLEIDLYLLPSNWNRNWWLSIIPVLANKLEIWAAGVEDGVLLKKEVAQKILVYKKDVPLKIFENVIDKLKEKNLDYQIVEYGKFEQKYFFDLLNRNSVLIYLQYSESQGMALLEAWSRNVTTFVWGNKNLKYKDYSWTDDNLAAPYMNKSVGSFFENTSELSSLLDNILTKKEVYNPRNYYLDNFTDKICAHKFINLIKK